MLVSENVLTKVSQKHPLIFLCMDQRVLIYHQGNVSVLTNKYILCLYWNPRGVENLDTI